VQILCASVQIWCAIASVGAGPGAGRPSSNRELWSAPSRREDIPVLPHAAIAHAQFETIHPSSDGNGRTGRALVHALLRSRAGDLAHERDERHRSTG